MSEGFYYTLPEGRTKLLEEFGFKKEEVRELRVPLSGVSTFGKTGYPEPEKSYRLSWEVYDLSLEEPYFWVLEILKDHFEIVEKLEDSFAAAENSAFFGITQQRLGAQQDKISQFLATTGKMIKELFQMVRELRIIDERLGYYEQAESELSKPLEQRGKGAEITLKGIFVDLVQGGGKSAASVYGMARELEFVTLPDLFFDAPPFKSSEELEQYIKGLEKDFNRNLLRVLHRHLHQFMEWKKRTHSEHQSRKRFMLSYLKQHFEIIKMYINWVKPYLRHAATLTMKEKNMRSPDLIAAFEGSMLDIELLARKREKVSENVYSNGCVLATFNYRTRPEMKVIQEGYQRGPVHIGRYEMNLRIYYWSDRQVENYRKLKEKETILLMGEISSSVREAMESLGAELERYLKEAQGEEIKEKKEEKKPSSPSQKSFAEKFFGDFYTPSAKKKESGKAALSAQEEEELIKSKKKESMDRTKAVLWNTYKNFKKAHGMIAW